LHVRDAMSTEPLSARRRDTVAEAARRMRERDVHGALVEPEGGDTTGIVTARDVLELVAAGGDPSRVPVEEAFTAEPRTAEPDWTLERAAEAMVEGGFRHLVVVEGGSVAGVISIRDIVAAWSEPRARRPAIPIREAVNRDAPRLGTETTLHDAAGAMVETSIGAVIVERDGGRPELFAERDLLDAVAAGLSPATERIGDHCSERLTYSAPDWSLKQAADAMLRGGFQHVIVVDQHETVGIISMRDILRRWLD
jgi:CBS domain-containing protein